MLRKALIVFSALFLSLSLLSIRINFDLVKAVNHSYSGTYVGGVICENTTWTLENSPYIVVEDVFVEEHVFLTIEPGVTVKFTDGTSLVIRGALVARGNDTYKITFTSNNIVPKPGDWNRIWFTERSVKEANILDWVVVEYGSTAIYCVEHSWENPFPSRSFTIANSTLRFNIIAVYSYDCPTYGTGNRLVIKNCTITNNGLGIEAESTAEIYASTISYNRHGICAYPATAYSGSYVKIYESTLNNNERAVLHYRHLLYIIESNVLYNHEGIYIETAGAPYPETDICKSIISFNTGTGINCTRRYVTLRITNSTIVNNGDNGIHFSYGPLKADVNFCNIFNNTPYNIVNNAEYGNNINATYNWWGATNETLIEEYIYDYHDDPYKGKVFYKPYLTIPAVAPLIPPDIVPPVSIDDYNDEWHNNDFSITLRAADHESGVAETYYRINNGPVKAVSINGQPLIAVEGANNTLEYWSVDNAGNEELPHKILTGIKLDKTAPSVITSKRLPEGDVEPDQTIKILVNATDSLSGVGNVILSYNINNSPIWTNITMTFNITTGLYEATIQGQQADTLVKYKIIAYDNAENFAVDDNNGEYYVYTVIPEFPSTIFLLLFIIAALAVVVFKREHSKHYRNSGHQKIYSQSISSIGTISLLKGDWKW
ncbi:right-handed parallel beta-helix repeat-containing protein [Candidatus Bathyarchaeota archaeon]|nr:right-handed parallel beta-helix repeat-containing protein [Candidatus Bathyarchaeota archaeon]